MAAGLDLALDDTDVLFDAAGARTELMERRVVAATLACVARFGLSKLTIDDVAREAGCGRATLYRYVGGKQQLIRTAVDAEVERLALTVSAAVTGADDLEGAVVATLTTLARELAASEAIQFLLAYEPELVLPYVTFDGAGRFLADARALLAPAFGRFADAERAERVAEWITRVVLSYVCSPDVEVSMTDESDVRTLVRAFVLPGLAGKPEPARGSN